MHISAAKPLIVLVAMMSLLLSAQLPSVHGSTPIVFDATAHTSCSNCGPTVSWSHTVGSGSNRILVVGVGDPGSGIATVGPGTVASITYGGTPLTFITAKNDPPNNNRAEMWYLLNPPTGTATIQVTFTSSPIFRTYEGSVSYLNVAGIGNFDSASGNGNPASMTVNANSGDLVVDTLAGYAGFSPSATPGAGQTQRWNVVIETSFGAGSDKAASSPVTMTWSLSGSDTPTWALIGVDLKPAAVPVGGEMLPVNLTQVLAPWIAAMLALTVLGVETLVVRRKKNLKA